MADKVLLVDDDTHILQAFKRNLRKQFKIDTAVGGKEGLDAISANDPYSVIVSDMQMPEMNGIQFLSKAKELSPDSVRIMLTGNADMETAIQAVNKGNIFRFLIKPCPQDIFVDTLKAGIKQFQLITAERELLEKTLSGSVKVLVDILSIVSPMAFSRSVRLRGYSRHVARQLELPNAWRYELAALLSQIGCVTFPPETIEKIYAGQELTDGEYEIFKSYPKIGSDLLIKIPRLQPIALMIEKQHSSFEEYESSKTPQDQDITNFGAQILKVAYEFDEKVSRGTPVHKAIDKMLEQRDKFDPLIVEALRGVEIEQSELVPQIRRIQDLEIGVTLGESVSTKTGTLLIQKGQEISFPMLKLLKNYLRNGLIADKVRVNIPKNETGFTQKTSANDK